MYWNTVKSSLKESVRNIFRHPLVTIASITTIALMLLIVAGFTAFSLNARALVKAVSQTPPVVIYADYEISEDALNAINDKLASSPQVLKYTAQSPKENYELFRQDLGEEAKSLDNFDPSVMAWSFVINLKSPEMLDTFKLDFQGLIGVRKIVYSDTVMTFFTQTRSAVNIASAIIFAVLCLISLFIISNMVRISILARGEEIQIMKYVGATNLYIRIPYLVEGAVIGFVGAIIATMLMLIAYRSVYSFFMDGIRQSDYLKLLPITVVGIQSFMVCLLIGILIGAMGSWFSVKRYINV